MNFIKHGGVEGEALRKSQEVGSGGGIRSPPSPERRRRRLDGRGRSGPYFSYLDRYFFVIGFLFFCFSPFVLFVLTKLSAILIQVSATSHELCSSLFSLTFISIKPLNFSEPRTTSSTSRCFTASCATSCI